MIIKNQEWAPDFIGIGAMKSASYWIYKCLEAHPGICVSSKKEVHFFDSPNYDNGVEWYRSFFSHCEQELVKGEFTPDYLSNLDAASLIYKHFPEVKIIACLRNPVERAYSHYRFNVTRKGKMSIYNNFEEALEKDAGLVQTGYYYQQLKKYFELFPKESIRVMLYDDIQNNPAKFLAELYTFIGVDAEFSPPITNAKKGVTGVRVAKFKIPYLNPLLYKISDLIQGGFLDKILTHSGVKRRVNRMLQKNKKMVDAEPGQEIKFPSLSPETFERLLLLYSDDMSGLEKLIGRDLSLWHEY